MSSAVYRPVQSFRGVQIFERLKVYRDQSGAASRNLNPRVQAQPLHFALDSAVTEVRFLESETSMPQPIDLTLTNKSKETDPYLNAYLTALYQTHFAS